MVCGAGAPPATACNKEQGAGNREQGKAKPGLEQTGKEPQPTFPITFPRARYLVDTPGVTLVTCDHGQFRAYLRLLVECVMPSSPRLEGAPKHMVVLTRYLWTNWAFGGCLTCTCRRARRARGASQGPLLKG